MKVLSTDAPEGTEAFPSGYTIKQASRLLDLKESQIRSWIQAGFLEPRRSEGGAFRFSFQDLVLLRSAKELAADLTPHKVKRALTRLRHQLPRGKALSAVRIMAEGDDVVVREGNETWEPASGQVQLNFDVAELTTEVAPLVDRAAREAWENEEALGAEDWYELGCDLEVHDEARAREAYVRALELDSRFADAHLNLGRLHHEAGELREAEACYRGALEADPEEATAWFDLGVALQDEGRSHEARRCYYDALSLDPDCADAHYNLAQLYQNAEKPRMAEKHMRSYQKLIHPLRGS